MPTQLDYYSCSLFLFAALDVAPTHALYWNCCASLQYTLVHCSENTARPIPNHIYYHNLDLCNHCFPPSLSLCKSLMCPFSMMQMLLVLYTQTSATRTVPLCSARSHRCCYTTAVAVARHQQQRKQQQQ
eukprot:16032-Heterococcus_DN1.PRE.1